MQKPVLLRLMLILIFFAIFLGCSRKSHNTSDSAKIEVEDISDGIFFYRPIIIFIDDRKVENYSASLLPKETVIKAVVQKDYDVEGLYVEEPITKIIAQSPSAEITFFPRPGNKYNLFGKIIDKKASLWIEDASSGKVVAGSKPY